MAFYLIVRIGNRCIEEMLFPTQDANEAIDKMIELRKTRKSESDNPNSLCVRMWEGSRFSCRCLSMGIKQLDEFEQIEHVANENEK